jgi:hypothetical protein
MASCWYLKILSINTLIMKNTIKNITSRIGITENHLALLKGHLFLLYINAIKIFYILYR